MYKIFHVESVDTSVICLSTARHMPSSNGFTSPPSNRKHYSWWGLKSHAIIVGRFSIPRGQSGRGVKLTTHIYVVPCLRMNGAISRFMLQKLLRY